MTTMTATERKWSTPTTPTDGPLKFPDYDASTLSPQAREHLTIFEEGTSSDLNRANSRSPQGFAKANGISQNERWTTRKEHSQPRANGYAYGVKTHTRQKSLSDAIRTIHARRGSVSQSAQEIAEALKAPVSYQLIGLCLVWYISSALTNTSSKSILNAYPKPITLTIVQFAFVSLWCWISARIARVYQPLRTYVPALKDGLRPPTEDVIRTTLPLALFQLGGHVLSSSATQRIPVSLVHTIKGLSPLFTVLAYRVFFNINYTLETYLSLVPLTLGVVMACSVEFSGNFIGIISAFVAALIFVAQNIFSKKLFNEAARAEADALPPTQLHPKKLDKLNLLFYCSGLAFLLSFPLWLWLEGFSLLADVFTDGKVSLSSSPSALDHGPLALEFIFNGVFHFGQNIIAFILLSRVSPVTYSVASLIKRVFVIVVAILWFRSPTTKIQALGILLTFFGLYLYDRTHDSARAAKHIHKSEIAPILPLSTSNRRNSTAISETPTSINPRQSFNYDSRYAYTNGNDKKADAYGPGGSVAGNRAEWLPPRTKQQETWQAQDTRA